MVKKKFENSLIRLLVFIFLLLFPLGVLPAQLYPSRGHLIDLVVFILGVIYILKTRILPRKYLFSSIIVVSTALLSPISSGVLYLVRFCSYFVFIFVICEIIRRKLFTRAEFVKYLLYVSTVIATFGLVQYILLPDLRPLKLFGWDDHYFRLVSTFLDPAFTGILLVLGIILSVYQYYKHKSANLLFVIAFLSTALGLTYSRASFLSLAVGLVAYYGTKRWRMSVTSIVIIICATGLLPTSAGGEGVNLARTSSISAKSLNFEESVKIISTSPLFGIGMNNICEMRVELFNYPGNSHACAGLDNSILFILATTGIVGLVSFTYIAYQFYLDTKTSPYSGLLVSSAAATLVHSMFTNTLFYPWVMGWMAILLGLSYSTLRRRF